MYRYSKAQENWLRLTPSGTGGFPTPRTGACLAWDGTTSAFYGTNDAVLALFGGQKPDGTYSGELNLYDIDTNNWIYKDTGGAMGGSYAFAGCGKIASGQSAYPFYGIVVYGGVSQSGYDQLAYVFCDVPNFNGLPGPGCMNKPGRHWTNIFIDYPMPAARFGMAFLENGGVTDHRTTCPNGAACYSVGWMIWGGMGSGGQLNDAWLFFLALPGTHFKWLQFAQTGSVPSARYGAGVAHHVVGNPNQATTLGMLVTHGYSAGGMMSDTYDGEWTLSGSSGSVQWTKLTVSASYPSGRYYPLFACYKPPAGQPWNACPGNGSPQTTGYLFFGGYKEGRTPVKYWDTWTGVVNG